MIMCLYMTEPRPFITEEILERGLAGVRETGACVVGMPSKDTVKLSDEDGFVRIDSGTQTGLDDTDAADIFL